MSFEHNINDYNGDPEGFLAHILEHLKNHPDVDPVDAAVVMLEAIAPASQARDVVSEYRTALVARGYERIALELQGVTIRLGRTMCGIGYKLRKSSELNLNALDAEERTVMTLCIVDVLRAYELDASVGDDGQIVFDHHCDNPDHDHGKDTSSLKPDFQRTIDTFVHEMDAEFGPSVPEPGASRWDRWM